MLIASSTQQAVSVIAVARLVLVEAPWYTLKRDGPEHDSNGQRRCQDRGTDDRGGEASQTGGAHARRQRFKMLQPVR